MRAVGLIGMGQPGTSLAQKGNRLSGGLGTKRVQNSLVESLDDFVNCHTSHLS